MDITEIDPGHWRRKAGREREREREGGGRRGGREVV